MRKDLIGGGSIVNKSRGREGQRVVTEPVSEAHGFKKAT